MLVSLLPSLFFYPFLPFLNHSVTYPLLPPFFTPPFLPSFVLCNFTSSFLSFHSSLILLISPFSYFLRCMQEADQFRAAELLLMSSDYRYQYASIKCWLDGWNYLLSDKFCSFPPQWPARCEVTRYEFIQGLKVFHQLSFLYKQVWHHECFRGKKLCNITLIFFKISPLIYLFVSRLFPPLRVGSSSCKHFCFLQCLDDTPYKQVSSIIES